MDSFDDFPPFPLVTASSEASFAGFDDPDGSADFPGGRFSQHFPVGSPEVARLDFLFASNSGTCKREIPAKIFRCDSARDFGAHLAGTRPLAETTLHLIGSSREWVTWNTSLTVLSGMKVGGYLRVELELPPGVAWLENRIGDPVFPSAFAPPDQALHFCRPVRSHCFRISPAQPCFWAANVLPELPNRNRFTGTWRSDPQAGFPQWIDFSWRDPLPLAELRLDFPDSPERPTQYRIQTFAHAKETARIQFDAKSTVAADHAFAPPVPADRIRLTFFDSRGGASVALDRIRLRSADPTHR